MFETWIFHDSAGFLQTCSRDVRAVLSEPHTSTPPGQSTWHIPREAASQGLCEGFSRPVRVWLSHRFGLCLWLSVHLGISVTTCSVVLAARAPLTGRAENLLRLVSFFPALKYPTFVCREQRQ